MSKSTKNEFLDKLWTFGIVWIYAQISDTMKYIEKVFVKNWLCFVQSQFFQIERKCGLQLLHLKNALAKPIFSSFKYLLICVQLFFCSLVFARNNALIGIMASFCILLSLQELKEHRQHSFQKATQENCANFSLFEKAMASSTLLQVYTRHSFTKAKKGKTFSNTQQQCV